MDHQRRSTLIARYKDGYREVAAALEGATDKELDARPAPGKWSAREIVHHLADSEMTSAVRLRLLVAEEHAAIRAVRRERVCRHGSTTTGRSRARCWRFRRRAARRASCSTR